MYRRAADRFVVSYDLWEEKFSVTQLQIPQTFGQAPTARKTASHLSALAAETWCLTQMPMEITGLGETEKLWARLEVRAQNGRDSGAIFGRSNLGESGISLASLIEIFSRPAQPQQSHWTVDAGPLTLADVKRGRANVY